MKYRKKPVMIEAWQLTKKSWRDIETIDPAKIHFLGNRTGDGDDDLDCLGLSIDTLEGPLTAIIGDWIIKGVQGEFYPCKPDIFAATYEPVSE